MSSDLGAHCLRLNLERYFVLVANVGLIEKGRTKMVFLIIIIKDKYVKPPFQSQFEINDFQKLR